MINQESISELERLAREYRQALRALNQLARRPRVAEPGHLLELHAHAKDLGNMLSIQAHRLNRAVEATTGEVVRDAPHLQAHPRLRKYVPPHLQAHPLARRRGR